MKLVNSTDILGGKRFSYLEVFNVKDGMVLGTKSNGVLYYIYDHYCMNPSCKCDDVVLHYAEDDGLGNNKGREFAILLSLTNKKYEILDAYEISQKHVKELVDESLKNNGNEAIELYKKRYTEMKAVGREVLQEKNEGLAPVQAKIERNSPCPCGSGKKYKKCCGAN